MTIEKQTKEKHRLHPRNKNRDRYDLAALISVLPELLEYVTPNKFGDDSVDFSNPKAVKLLNKALLNHYYDIKHWEFPDENLCPPIPGRVDYIHYMADLLAEFNFGRIPKGEMITCLDVGVGANCIYPLLGVTEYGWNFIGSDVDPKSIESANKIAQANPSLKDKIECRLQKNPKDLFYGIIGKEDKIDLSICNPPFHTSSEEAQKGTRRKVKNLTGETRKNPLLNFSGVSNELIYEGGEHKFIHTMIKESKNFAKNCLWFSTLVSKQSNLKGIYNALETMGAKQVKTIPMGTGNKSSRIVAWTYLNKEERKQWCAERWKVRT
jgi:23S rRNA (adenine1618-N6)-methyltransferase